MAGGPGAVRLRPVAVTALHVGRLYRIGGIATHPQSLAVQKMCGLHSNAPVQAGALCCCSWCCEALGRAARRCGAACEQVSKQCTVALEVAMQLRAGGAR